MRERERVELEAVADERGTGNKRENQIGTTHTWEGLVDQLLSNECGTSSQGGPSSRSQQPLRCSCVKSSEFARREFCSFCGVTEDTFQGVPCMSWVSSAQMV